MPFEITKDYLLELQLLIEDKNDDAILQLLEDVHYADIAELIEDLVRK